MESVSADKSTTKLPSYGSKNIATELGFNFTDITKNASVSSVKLMSVPIKFDKVFTINSIQRKKEGKWYSMTLR